MATAASSQKVCTTELSRRLIHVDNDLVYTRPAPRIPTTSPNNIPTPKPSALPPVAETANDEGPPTITQETEAVSPLPKSPDLTATTPTPKPLSSLFPSSTTSSSVAPPAHSANAAADLSTSSAGSVNGNGRLNAGQDSQVLHETLNVINEHITDLHSTQENGGLRAVHSANDSGSEYSSHMGQRMSYIQGEETDEEEDGAHSRDEVLSWSADDVAEYLFTIGVEKYHCEVFRDQEITGEVILGMDQTSVFIKALELGSVGRRLKTWQKIKALQDEVNGVGITKIGRAHV